MFRIGGSAGTGITSGLDQPRMQYKNGKNVSEYNLKDYERERRMLEEFMRREQLQKEMELDLQKKKVREQKTMAADGGRIGYEQGSTPNFMAGSIPGFLTGFGLNLLATPPAGNIFQTSAIAARDPFNRLQASQAAQMKTESDRAFARELSQEEMDFQRELQTEKLAAQKEIAGMKTTDTTERIQAIADTKYDGDTIKAQREVDFATKTYPNLISEYGQESVATSVIDSSGLQKPKDINRFVKQNPQLARQVVYDVRTGKAMRFVKDQTGKFALIPADSTDMDPTGEDMPDPNKPTAGLFGQKTKPDVITPAVKEFLKDKDRSDFGIGFYD